MPNGCFEGEIFHARGGEIWRNIHPASACEGEVCVIHNPSHHVMSNWRMHLRETTLVERICEHGVGHPDPDSVAYFERQGIKTMGMHGCCGCCTPEGAYCNLD